MLVFTLLPILDVFRISVEPANQAGFTLAHYRQLFSHEGFGQAALNTILIAVGSVSVEIFFGLILALVLSASARAARLMRPIFILPLAIPTVVVAVMMSFLFSSSGWINRILGDIGLIEQPILWLNGGTKSLLAIILADAWKVTPLVMFILLAGLLNIDPELYHAARVDGASAWMIFKTITWPLLLPSVSTAIIIRGIDAFRIFGLVMVLMGQNMKVIGTYAYLEYMEYQNPHLSAASAVVLFVIILAAVAVYLKMVGKHGLSST